MTPAEIVQDMKILARLAQSSFEEWGEITPTKKAAWGYDPLAASLRFQRDTISKAWERQKAPQGKHGTQTNPSPR